MTVDSLDPFPGLGEFYAYRGEPGSSDSPPIWLPVQQGDVFRGVAVPGLDHLSGSEVPLAMVFMHPCVMRKGAVLADRITVFRVRQETKKVKTYETYAGHYSVMPLPDLFATGAGLHFGEFQMVGTVGGAMLNRTERVMSLSKEGRLLLQQRAVHHFTRHAPPLHDLRLRTRAVEREAELLTDWCEATCDSKGETADVVAAAEKDFDKYLTEETRRDRLADDDSTNAVVAEAHREIRQRYS